MKRTTFLNPSGTRNQRNLLPEYQPQMKWGIILSHDDGVALVPYGSLGLISSANVVPQITFGVGNESAASRIDNGDIIAIDYTNAAERLLVLDGGLNTKKEANTSSSDGYTQIEIDPVTDNIFMIGDYTRVYDRNLNILNTWTQFAGRVQMGGKHYMGGYLILTFNQVGDFYITKWSSTFVEEWDYYVTSTGSVLDVIVDNVGGEDLYITYIDAQPGVATEFHVIRVDKDGVLDPTFQDTQALVAGASAPMPFGLNQDDDNIFIHGGGFAQDVNGFISKVDKLTGTNQYFNAYPVDAVYSAVIDPADGQLIYSKSNGYVYKQLDDGSDTDWFNIGTVDVFWLLMDKLNTDNVFALTSGGDLKHINAFTGATLQETSGYFTFPASGGFGTQVMRPFDVGAFLSVDPN